MDIKIKFWKRVRELRKELWLSQEKLAFKAKFHRTYISDVERGVKNVSLENIWRLAEALWKKEKDLFINF